MSDVVELKPRRLPDFIEAFEEYGQVFQSTPNFIRAGALWMLGTACLRNLAMQSGGNTTYLNLYLGMVAGPGTGKSQTVAAIRSVFIPSVPCSIIPPSITRAALEDYMQDNMMKRLLPGGSTVMANECIGLSDEMHGILPDQDLSHLTLYNSLYDMPKIYKARTRGSGEIRLEYPYCSILTGAQPALLAQTLPELAWGMGFMSRLMMVFDVAPANRNVFDFSEPDHKLLADLIHDLKLIHTLNGWIKWDAGAQDFYRRWWVEGNGEPKPTAARLAQGYNARRGIHFLKLSMIMSISRSNSLIVTKADAMRALQFQLETEDNMRYIFNEMAQSGSHSAIQDAIEVVRVDAAAGRYTDESVLITMLMLRFPSTQVKSIIDNLVSSEAIEVRGVLDSYGCRKFSLGRKAATA